MSERGQVIMIWWGLILMLIYGTVFWTMLDMCPPPAATLDPAGVAAFYTQHETSIRLGAMITSWTSAFMLPFSTVVAIQMARLERGTPVWAVLAFGGGIMMSIFLVLPPLFWGVAAFNPARLPDATALMNDLANLTLTTTDQFYIFQMIGITYVSLTQAPDPNSGIPRWLGWFTLWSAVAFEVGALAFMFKTGPFAWNGILVFWMPFCVFGAWIAVMSFTMLKALKRQQNQGSTVGSRRSSLVMPGA